LCRFVFVRRVLYLVQYILPIFIVSCKKKIFRDLFVSFVSRPLLAFGLGEYWFRISLYVNDRNRPLAPILRHDVYLTCIDGDV
jgi:hypothetical protein